MSKTPVSTLQEYAVKRNWGFPEYTLITQDSGAHINTFTYRVTCKSLDKSACGTASRKQEAKHVAARELLKLLGLFNNIIPSNENIATEKSDSYYLPGKVAHENVFVNSVGKLNEHCAIKKLKIPEYRVTGQYGPPHAMNFTIVCTIGDLVTKATANTKKQAKQDAAQIMHDILVRNKISTDIHGNSKNTIVEMNDVMSRINILNLNIEQPSVNVTQSAVRAKELFPKLQRFSGTSKVVSTINVHDYHRALFNSIDSEVRQSIRKLLSSDSMMSKKKMMINVTNLLGLSFELKTFVRTKDRVIVTCTLDSRPLITDIGVGITSSEAEEQAIINSLNSIDTLLK